MKIEPHNGIARGSVGDRGYGWGIDSKAMTTEMKPEWWETARHCKQSEEKSF